VVEKSTVPVSTADAMTCVLIDNLLVRIHLIIAMIRWAGLAPWEFVALHLPPYAGYKIVVEKSTVPVSTADAMTCVLQDNSPAGVQYQVLLSLSLSLALSLSLSPSLYFTHTHTHSHTPSVSHTHTHTLSLSHIF